MNHFILLVALVGVSAATPLAVNSNIILKTDYSEYTNLLNGLLDGYDKRLRPEIGGDAVDVIVSAHIINVDVNEAKKEITVDMYFRQQWNDERLQFSSDKINMIMSSELASKVWVPDTFFANENAAYFHMATTPNQFLSIKPNGDVKRSVRLTVTFACPMTFTDYPNDEHVCPLEIESYGYSMSDIDYHFKPNNSIGISSQFMSRFKIESYNGHEKVEMLSSGNYKRLIMEFKFKRSKLPYPNV